MPVDRARDHGEDLRSRGVRGDEAKCGVGLEHLVLGRPEAADLEEVVHDADVSEAVRVGGAGDLSERRTDPLGATGPGEVRDLKADAHTPSNAGAARSLP